jgi:TPR repeat protein
MRENMTGASPKKSGAVVWSVLAVFIAASSLAAVFWPSTDPVDAVVSAVPPKPVPPKAVALSLPAEDKGKLDKTDSLYLSSDLEVIKAGLAEYGSKPPASNLSEPWIRARAEEKDSTAFLPLGALYATGDGVIKDDEEAAKWFRLHALKVYDGLYQRASKGDVEAMGELYRRFIKGVGFPKNYIQGCKWVLRAAASGDLNNSKDLIRDFYEKCDVRPGLTDPLFHETYLSLLREAAFKGGADEKVHLATTLQICADYWKSRALQEGPYPATQKNVQLNLSLKVEAYAWYNISAAMRHPDAAKKRDALHEVSAAGQKRSREILLEIEKRKASK